MNPHDWNRYEDWHGCQCWTKTAADGGELLVLFGREARNGKEPAVWHLSISVRSARIVNVNGFMAGKRTATFEELKEARYRFIPDDVNMAMMFPPEKFWITLPDSVVLHLWEVPIEMADLSGAIEVSQNGV